ncbi:GreA/GreB family elongation factor [Winogradskyella flava]|uniref:GreA/GreB family elongation factor n=1 Tax=Winogradskyella flava TaxID=1884876 RepID=A0A842IP06_9FLAO|nr:GreA/GreB family elongation factor [Winogradskyella flava]MBC2843939.1 GreA/GreB family elongation factor [Winogradskyella flava]
MNIKAQLHFRCQEILNKRLLVIQESISDIQIALQSETKSSAGDKHETGRAMLQLEREKAGQQLAELQKLIETLQRIDTEIQHNTVALGSVVKTTDDNYFISVSIGEIKLQNESFYGISIATPIGQLLFSKSVGDEIRFRTKTFIIIDIL